MNRRAFLSLVFAPLVPKLPSAARPLYSGTLTIGLEPGLAIRALNTPEAVRVLVRVARKP